MEKSEQLNELAAALSAAQGVIDNPSKNSTNPFYKSKYADLAEVLSVVRPAFSANGLSVTQHPEVSEGNIVVTTLVLHTSGQWVSSKISMPEGKDPQATGKIITYFRRYALSAIAGISQEDDDGNSGVTGEKPSTPNNTQRQESHPSAAKNTASGKFKCKTTGKFAPAYCQVCPQKANCPEDSTSPEQSDPEILDETYYIAQIDKLESANAVLNWSDKNLSIAQENLTEIGYEKLKSYISQIVDIFNK